MKILYSIPGLSINADAPWVTRYRAGGMVDAGIEVTLLVRDEFERSLFSDFPGEVLIEGAEQRSGGLLREFIVRPARSQWHAFDIARKIGAHVLFFSHPEPWTLLPTTWLMKRHSPAVAMFAACVYYYQPTSRLYPFLSRVRGWLNLKATKHLCRIAGVIYDNPHVPPFFGMRPDTPHAVIQDGYREDMACQCVREKSRIRLDIPVNRRVLLSFGAASLTKGQDLLLEALRGLKPDFDVYIVGPTGGVYTEPSSLGQDLMSTRWNGHLHFVPKRVSDAEMHDYFAAADAVILPYRRGFVSTSGNFRLAVECGIPVLAADQYFIGAMIKERGLGLLFTPEDIVAMRSMLLEFSHKPISWFETIKDNAARVAHDESWSVVGQRYRQYFSSLIRSREGY